MLDFNSVERQTAASTLGRDPVELFREAMRAEGLEPPALIIGDGLVHRFQTQGDGPGETAGYYILHLDGIVPNGMFGCFRRGLEQAWVGRQGLSMSEQRRAQYIEKIREAQAQREAEKAARQATVKAQAKRFWDTAQPLPDDYPYLVKKKIEPHAMRYDGDRMLVPVTDGQDIWSIQYIDREGEKLFLKGGRKKGCFLLFGDPTTKLFIAEGFATAATIREVTTEPVAMVFDAGNILPAVQALRTQYPSVEFIICADDDWKTVDKDGNLSNPGLTKAQEAAVAIGASVAVPEFGENRPEKAKDFNDMAALLGPDKVRECILRATWPDPIPLPTKLAPVEPFNVDFLPKAVAPLAQDIADRMQCALDFIGVAIITALGATLGTKLGIWPKLEDDWFEVANFWCCFIGRPGILKSPALREALRFLREFDTKAKKEHEEATKVHKGDLQAFTVRKQVAASMLKEEIKQKIKGDTVVDLKKAKSKKEKTSDEDENSNILDFNNAKKQRSEELNKLIREVEPEEPKARRYIVNDTSYEKLGVILSENPQGVLVERDELVSLLTYLDREELANTRGFYLQGWNGTGTYDFDRIGRGYIGVSNLCIGLIGCATPGGIESYVDNAITGGKGDDGLIQRFSLAVWPDQGGWTYVDRKPDSEKREKARGAFERLNELDVAGFEADSEDPAKRGLRLSPEASARFVLWLTPLEAEVRGSDAHPALLSHFAKYRKLVPTVALILHAADGHKGPISDDVMERAIRFAAYLRSHALRLYGAVTRAHITAAIAILAKIKAGALKEGFSARDVYRPQWAGLTHPGTVTEALELLERHHVIATRNMISGGRMWTVYGINPKAKS